MEHRPQEEPRRQVTKSQEPLVVLQRLGTFTFSQEGSKNMTHNGFYKKPQASAAPQLALRPRDAASAIGISLSTLERLTRSGEIDSVLVGRCRVYEIDSLKAYLASRRSVVTKGGDVA